MKLLYRFRAILMSLVLLTSVCAATAVFADDYGLSATAKEAKIPTDKNIPTIVGNVVGTALSMISVLFFGLMLYAGVKWMIARGDSDEARKALDTIVAAIIGIIIVMASYALTNFVFKSVGGTGSSSGAGDNEGELKPGEVYCGIHTDAGNTKSCVVASDNCAKDKTLDIYAQGPFLAQKDCEIGFLNEVENECVKTAATPDDLEQYCGIYNVNDCSVPGFCNYDLETSTCKPVPGLDLNDFCDGLLEQSCIAAGGACKWNTY